MGGKRVRKFIIFSRYHSVCLFVCLFSSSGSSFRQSPRNDSVRGDGEEGGPRAVQRKIVSV